jgi:hypothetical protein
MTTTRKNKTQSNMQNYSLDSFPCGALVTNSSRIITYVNTYFTTELLWQPAELIGKSTDVIFTKSSKYFFQVISFQHFYTRKRVKKCS